jgi:hypothetical protein
MILGMWRSSLRVENVQNGNPFLYLEKCVDLVDRYGISVSQITTDMLQLHLT